VYGCPDGSVKSCSCLCRPKPGQDELRIQEDELEAACWMPIDEFAENPAYADRPVWREVRGGFSQVVDSTPLLHAEHRRRRRNAAWPTRHFMPLRGLRR